MKIGGIDPKTLPVEEIFVLPRGDERIVFRASGLKDMEEFKKLCPEPIPPQKTTRDGVIADTEDLDYKAVLAGYLKRRMAYIVVHSLLPSQIEWDTVRFDNPATWTNWETDLKNAGLSEVECNRILGLVLEANCLDEAKLQKAREVFLQGTPKESGT